MHSDARDQLCYVTRTASHKAPPTLASRGARTVQLFLFGEHLIGMNLTTGSRSDATPRIYRAGFRLEPVRVELAAAVMQMAVLTYQGLFCRDWCDCQRKIGRRCYANKDAHGLCVLR
jgi:hypothetical protein